MYQLYFPINLNYSDLINPERQNGPFYSFNYLMFSFIRFIECATCAKELLLVRDTVILICEAIALIFIGSVCSELV